MVAGELLEGTRLVARRLAHIMGDLRRFIFASGGVFFEQTVGLPDRKVRAYAKRANLSQTEQEMAQCLQEAEQSDKKFTDIAISIMGG